MSILSVASITNLGTVAIGNATINATINSTSISVGSNVVINAVGISVLSGTVVDSIGNIRELPPTTQSASYTLVSTDSGKFISTTANVAIPASVFTAGQNISIFNNSSANITITQSAGVTMYLVGTANTGNRSLLQRGVATIMCTAANTFVVAGGGLL
jgi:hypothetical protein